MVAALPLAARASDPGAGPNAHHEASRIIAAELAMQDATDRLKALAGEHPSGLAQGPMQFLPSTWANYGNGGNINDPHAAILAAARYLVHYGAPYDMRTAIWHYNLDYNYVDSVELFARAYRADPAWLDRMYYWNTFG